MIFWIPLTVLLDGLHPGERTEPTQVLQEQLGSVSPDLLRQMLTTFMNTVMSAEADTVCGAPMASPALRRRSPDSRKRIRIR